MSAQDKKPLTPEQTDIIRDLAYKASEEATNAVIRTGQLAALGCGMSRSTAMTAMTIISFEVAGAVVSSALVGLTEIGIPESDIESMLQKFVDKLRRTMESAKKEKKEEVA